MTIEELRLRWQYFLIIDEEFMKTDKYVEHSIDNKSTYSVEFSKLLMLICSEFEMMCKLIHKHYDITFNLENYISILNLSELVLQHCSTIREIEVTSTLETNIQPLKNWYKPQDNTKCKLNLPWWTDYNNVKHNRHENFKKANLQNVADALASLYVLFIYMAFLLGIEQNNNNPVLDLSVSKSVICKYIHSQLLATISEYPPGFLKR